MSGYVGRFPWHVVDEAVRYHQMKQAWGVLDEMDLHAPLTKAPREEARAGNRAERRAERARRRKAALRTGVAAMNTRGRA